MTSCTVLVGSYAPADERGIRAFRSATPDGDDPDGGIVEIGAWSGVTNPSFLARSPDGRRLYAVSETEAGRVQAFDLAATDAGPELVPAGDAPSGGDHPCHLGIDPGGRWLAVSNYGSGTVSLLGLADGAMVTLDTVQLAGAGPVTGRQDGPHAHSAVPSADGRHLLVADLGADRLSVFEVAGDRLRHRSDAPVAAGAGPRHTTIRADGLVVVANELDCTLSTYRLDPDVGTLSPVASAATLPDDAPDSIVAEVQLSPGGERAFVSNRGDDSIAVFDLGPDGELALRGRFPCGGSWPRHFAVLPDGAHLLVANERSDELVLLPIDGDRLGAPAHRIGMPSPTFVLVL